MLEILYESNLTQGSKQLEKALEQSVEKAQQEAATAVVTEARRTHRYTRRTGTLARATQSETVRSVSKLYVSDAMAPYAYAIHEGFKGWAADPFLTDAIKKLNMKIVDTLSKAVDKAISKAGFSR